MLLLLTLLPCADGADFNFVPGTRSLLNYFSVPVVTDIDGDGWLEAVGAMNDRRGNLTASSPRRMGLTDLFIPGIRPSDARMADLNGDGCADLVAQGYSSGLFDSRALVYLGDGIGGFVKDTLFEQFSGSLGMNGSGEGAVVADFNNDGAVDLYLPYYTFNCPIGASALCPNARQNFLLLNDGRGRFRDVAVEANLAFMEPNANQPEGVQAVDINGDGLLDIYISGRLMINQGLVNGVPRFLDCACGLPSVVHKGDEGAKFLDWNNDGKLDLVIHHWNDGPTLYENTGSREKPYFSARTEADQVTRRPMFSTGAPNYGKVPYQDSFGINAYDIDNDGLEDIITAGSVNPAISMCPQGSTTPCPVYPNAIYRNTGSGFERVSAGAVSGHLGGGSFAFADINRDGKIDVLYPAIPGYYFLNDSNTAADRYALSIEMLGPNGEKNQFGHVVRVTPSAANGQVTYTRVVDGGSGYHAQNQYPILVGTAFEGAHNVVASFASRAQFQQSISVSFSMASSQYAQIFAPSAQYPAGRYRLSSQPPPSAFACTSNTLVPLLQQIMQD
jgi:hypothetical protein